MEHSVRWGRIIPMAVVFGAVLLVIGLKSFGSRQRNSQNSDSPVEVKHSEGIPKVGSLAPDFVLPTPPEGKMALSEQRGKVVFLNFWATWCPPCRAEMPSMEILYRKLKGKDFEMMAVSVDWKADKIRNLVEKLSLTFPILHDAEKKVARAYGIYGLPATFLIDKTGKVVFKATGARDWTDKRVVEQIEELIGRAEEGHRSLYPYPFENTIAMSIDH